MVSVKSDKRKKLEKRVLKRREKARKQAAKLTPLSAERANYQSRIRKAERFKWYGRAAIGFSCLMLVLLLGSILWRGWSGFLVTEITVPEATSFEQSIAELGVDDDQQRAALQLFSIDARRQYSHSPHLVAQSNVDLWHKGTLDESALLESGKLSPRQLAWLNQWEDQGRVSLALNTGFFTGGDSREPELAGFAASIVGSLLTVGMCLLIAFPLGVATAVYLEEFAPKNKLSDVIEVNINNLAAVPSIVFGLLGLSLYLNWFGMPRSAALVGGLTLALLILPVIIIASRASLRAVPASIRDAARGLGATELQVVWHHVLPLSLPGIMTGTILGIARAIGETAPLLMIGMVAFIADIPANATDPATAMPVQIFLWASSPELGFAEKTSAGIIVLLVILLSMNMLAIWLRNKFERKW